MRLSFRLLLSTLLAAFGLANAFAGEVGDPKIKSIECIAFGPKGMLLIGDGAGAQVVVINTGDLSPNASAKPDIADVKAEIANRIGTTADGIELQRMAVNPASGKAYVAVRRKTGKHDLIVTIDGTGKIAEYPVTKVDYRSFPLGNDGNAKVTKVTDITWAKDRILVAAQATDAFASRIFSINPTAKDVQLVVYSTETYHVAHRKWETKAPIRTVMPYEEDGKQYLVGAFTCTPIVKYPIDDLKDGGKVKGTSVVELGNGNEPVDMFPYEKDGKKYILLSTNRFFHAKNPVGPSARWVAKVDYDILKETTKINEKALWRTQGKASESNIPQAQVAKDYFGVTHMDQLNATQALVIRAEGDKSALRVLPLP